LFHEEVLFFEDVINITKVYHWVVVYH